MSGPSTVALQNHRRTRYSFQLPFVLVITGQAGTQTGQKLKQKLNIRIVGKESAL